MRTPVMARVRNLANWCNLSTPLGLAVALIGRARIFRGPRGLWMAEGYRLAFPVAGAFTLGSVVITASPSWTRIEERQPGLLAHEENHTWQYAYSLGLLYLPAYTACMCWSWLRTGDRAAANFFERAADLALGGYAHRPTRPVREGLREVGTLVRRPGTMRRATTRRGRRVPPNTHTD